MARMAAAAIPTVECILDESGRVRWSEIDNGKMV
jgi:hypothetical protein